MGTLFWLILAYPVVLVLANNDDTDTYTNTSLFFVEEYDDHDYSLLEEEDTETSTGDYFEDMILSRLESIDQTYDPFPISFILTFNKPVINIFFNFYFLRCHKTSTKLGKLLLQEFFKIGRLVLQWWSYTQKLCESQDSVELRVKLQQQIGHR